jgi:Peptidase M60, enhancin and enhancin-like/Putative mucin or carbohydrate-binding module/N-terminal domain of M60-like peptidases
MDMLKGKKLVATALCMTTFVAPYVVEMPKVYAMEEVGTADAAYEQRTFHLSARGNVDEVRDLQRRGFSFSPYEPTGIYAKPNESLTIEIKGNQSIQAYIGTYGYDKEAPKKYTLNPGENVISSPNGGILYFYNANDSEEVTANVKNGGSHFPLFILGKHTKDDWDKMLGKFPNPYAVELRGEESLITSSYDSVEKHMSKTNPIELLKKHDEAIRIQHKISGLSPEGIGVANEGRHSIHFAEDPHTDGWMYATNYRTGYHKNAIGPVLNVEKFITDGWGPWHEVGHQHQQAPWTWDAVGEVTVNIYSLAVQKAFGQPSRLEKEGYYKKAFTYINQPDLQKDYDKIDDLFVKAAMFWQLHLAYGDQFYPKLHQLYRTLPKNEVPTSDEAKKQMFIYMTSKVANQNLLPFFEKWGLHADSATIEKINKLALPALTKDIWLSTDSKPIVEKQVETYEIPYAEATSNVQDVLVGETFEKRNANDFVQNLGKNVKTTGRIELETEEEGIRLAKVEIIDDKGNTNLITVPVNLVYGDSFVFQGLSDDIKSIVTLHHDTKKLSATATADDIHYYFKDELYMGITVYDANKKEKVHVEAMGTETTENFAKQLNGLTFEYGDIMKVHHSEPSRLKVYQQNNFAQQGKVKATFWEVTPQGFKQRDSLVDVKAVPQQLVVGTKAEQVHVKNFVEVVNGGKIESANFVGTPNFSKIGKQMVRVQTTDTYGHKKVVAVPVSVIYGDSIVFQGLGNEEKSIVTLNHDIKKLNVTATNGEVHYYFPDETYMAITVYDKNNNEKKRVEVKGTENTKEFQQQLNEMDFEYGDTVKVYHRESNRLKWYDDNTFINEGKPYKAVEISFEVTPQGFVERASTFK